MVPSTCCSQEMIWRTSSARAQRKDHEIDAGNAQRGQADHSCKQRACDTGKQNQDRIGREVEPAGDDIHAAAEERRGGE